MAYNNQGTTASSAVVVVAEEVDSKKAQFVIKRLIKLQSASHLTQFLSGSKQTQTLEILTQHHPAC